MAMVISHQDVLGEPGLRLNPDRVDPEPDYTEIQRYGARGIQSRGLHSFRIMITIHSISFYLLVLRISSPVSGVGVSLQATTGGRRRYKCGLMNALN